MSKKTSTLSLCMIVKNEEELLPDCLESVKNVVDQMVIVDTGSSDRTIEIAKRFGAEVYHFKWCDDFSAARNESLRYATGDWILWMDADERLESSSIKELRACLKKAPRPSFVKVSILNEMDKGKNIHFSDAHRLFTNHSNIIFEDRIHEQIYYSARRRGAKEIPSTITLRHLGYDFSKNEKAIKLARNRVLLEKMVREKPNSAYVHYTLGQNYHQAENPEKAITHYLKTDALKQFHRPMKASLFNCMAESYLELSEINKANDCVDRSLKISKKQFMAWYLKHKVTTLLGNHKESAGYLEIAMENAKYLQNNPKTISTDTIPPFYQLHLELGNVLLKANLLIKALTHYQAAYDSSNNNLFILQKIIPLAQELNALEVLRSVLTAHISSGDDKPELLDLLGVTLIKQNDYPEALKVYHKLFIRDSGNYAIRRRLAALYAETGQIEKAEELLNYQE